MDKYEGSMSIIGKMVSYYNDELIEKTGVVIDKYMGTKLAKMEYPSGEGGSIDVEQFISVEYYIVSSGELLYHAECSRVRKIVK